MYERRSGGLVEGDAIFDVWMGKSWVGLIFGHDALLIGALFWLSTGEVTHTQADNCIARHLGVSKAGEKKEFQMN
jgi:hypothetical protein